MPGDYDETEVIYLIGKLLPAETVTIRLIGFPGDVNLSLISDVCVESAHEPGFYVWDTTNIDFSNLGGSPESPSPGSPAVPEGFALMFPATILYVMRDSKGNQHAGKFIIGSFPEQVRRTYGNVQTLL